MKLTAQQFKVLQFIARGFTDREISEITNKSIRTIEDHRYKILKKLKAKNCAHAVSLAYKKSML